MVFGLPTENADRCDAGDHTMRAVRTPYCIFWDNRLNKKIFGKQHIQKTDSYAG